MTTRSHERSDRRSRQAPCRSSTRTRRSRRSTMGCPSSRQHFLSGNMGWGFVGWTSRGSDGRGGAGAMRETRVVGKPTTRCGRSMLRERPCSPNRLARGAEETLHSAQCRGRCVSARPCVDETTCDHCRVLRAPRPDRRDDKRALGGVTQSRSLPPMARAGGTTKETHAAQANGGAPSRASSSKRSGRASRGPRFVNCISSPRSWGCSSRWNPAAIM